MMKRLLISKNTNSNSRKETISAKRLIKSLALATAILVAGLGSAWGQCGPYQIYESFGTAALPTQGGTWAATSMTYNTTSISRTGLYGLVFNALNDVIRTPIIANPGVLSFWYKGNSTTTGTPKFTVQTSTDNATWTNRLVITSFTTSYQQASVDLGALGLTNIYIRIIDQRASGTVARYIDDLSITSTVATNNTVLIQGQSCTPTLTAGVTYSVYDRGGVNDQYSISQASAPMVLTPPAGYDATINFTTLATEASYDYLKLYNGTTTAATPFHTGSGWSGTTAPGSFTSSNATYSLTVDFTSDGSTNGNGFVGTLSLASLPSCTSVPSSLTSSVTSTTTATLSWTAGSPAPGSGYDIYYSTSSTAPIAGTAATTTTGAGVVTKNITGLTANSTYYWWVRSNCNGTDKGSWVSGGTFSTLEGSSCGLAQDLALISSPFSGTTVGYPNSFTTSCLSGTGGDRIFKIDVPNGSELYIGQSTNGYDSKHRIAYGGSCPGTTEINTGYVGNLPTQTTNGTSLGCLDDDDLTHYYFNNNTGSTQTVYWIQDGYSTDQGTFTLEWSMVVAPTCFAPTSPISSAVATTTATLSWTAASPAPGSGYDIYYSTSSTAPVAGTAATTTTGAGVVTKNITGLTANSTYYWWVRSNCDGTDKSTWVSGGTFYTCTGSCNSVCPSVVSSLPVTNQALSCTSVALPGSFSSSNVTVCGGASGSYLGGQEALYMFTPSSTGEITISYSGQTWSAIWLFQGCPTSGGTCVGSVGSSASTQSLTANVSSGVTYYVIFDTWPSPNSPCSGTFSITAPVGPPANDLCANATTLTVYANGACSNTSGTTVGASQEVASNPTCDATGTIKDVWYKFNSGNNSSLNFGITVGTAANVGIEFFSACGTLATGLSVNCDYIAQTPNPTVVSGFALNTEYYFRLYTNTTYDAAGTFNVCVYQNPAPTCASITSPSNGATGQTLSLNLQWSATTYAERYDVYLSDNQTLVNNQDASVKVSSDQTTTTYAASGLNGLTTYYWRVVPKNGAGAPSGCTTWSFTTSQPEYATAWISANTGDSWWCQGETRTVTVTVKNNGSVSWIDGGGADYNIGIKWNGEADYIVRVDAQNLAAGATQTFSFNVTAPSNGNNNLTFDVVKEGAFWFGNNSGGAGPGNVTYSKVANVNNTYPTANAGTDVSACVGSAVNLSGSSPNVVGSFSSTNSTSGSISDLVNLDRTIVVSGTNVNANQLTSLTLNLTHTYTGDLDITLFAPNGSSIDLSSDNGSTGDNYTNTVFSTSGTAITSGTAPFTGTFTPETPFSSLTGSADGTWTLRIYDDASGDVGTFTNWSINLPTSNAPSVAWSGPNSFTSSSLAPSVSSTIGGANNYTLTSTYRGCSVTDAVQITGTGPTTLATNVQNGDVVWQGSTSTDWGTASNWYSYNGSSYSVASSLPSTSANVIIPANQGCVAQQPTVISGTVNANNVIVETGAALTMTTGTLNVAGNFTINGTGTFTPGTGTVNFTGNGTQVVTNGTQVFNNVTIDGFGTVELTGNTTINGNFLNNAGTLNMGNHNITIGGNYANYSGLQIGSGSVIFNKASGTQTVDQLAVDFGNIQHTGAGTLQLASDISLTGNLTNSAGTISAQTFGITLQGDWTNSGTGVFNPGTGFVAFSKGSGTQTIDNGTSTFYYFQQVGGATLSFATIPEIKEDIDVNGPIAANTHFKLTGSGNQIIGGTVSQIAIQDFTVNKASGTVTISKPVRVSGTLTMTQGDIITDATNILEVGTSAASVGTVSWTAGTVRGPMKRWFAASTNSTQASGVFPVGATIPGKGVINRYAQVNFSSAPGAGGYIVAEYKTGTPSTGYTGLPLTYNTNQYIQNFEEEGYWDITPYNSSNVAYGALNTAPYTLKLRMNNPSTLQPGLPPSGSNGNSIANISNLRIITSKGPSHNSWVLAGTQGAGQAVLASGDYLLEETGVTGFSFFNGGGNDNNPLPVELVSFSGACDNGIINLTWQTASEFNSSHFDVEKSRDGENWQVLTTLPSAGTSNELITYQSTDQNGTEGNNYFRLRQVDIDGTEKLYDPINVSCSEVTTGYFSSFPNPSGTSFQVVVNNKELIGTCTLNMVDASGKVIEQRTIDVKEGINLFMINQDLNPGIYFLNITNGAKSTQILRHAVK